MISDEEAEVRTRELIALGDRMIEPLLAQVVKDRMAGEKETFSFAGIFQHAIQELATAGHEKRMPAIIEAAPIEQRRIAVMLAAALVRLGNAEYLSRTSDGNHR